MTKETNLTEAIEAIDEQPLKSYAQGYQDALSDSYGVLEMLRKADKATIEAQRRELVRVKGELASLPPDIAEQERIFSDGQGVSAVIQRALAATFGREFWFDIKIKVRRRSDYVRRGDIYQIERVDDPEDREQWARDLAAWEAEHGREKL